MAERTDDHVEAVSLGLHRLQRLLASRRVFSALAEVSGVALPQQGVQVLRALSDGGAHPVADVAKRAHMDIAAVSRQLRALADDDLVHRRPSASNGSVVLVAATAKGKRLARQIEAVRRRHLVDALAGWTPAERAQLGELLLRFVDDLQRTPYRSG